MNSFNQLWQCCPFSVFWLSGDLQFSVLVAVVDQLDIDDSGSPIPKWYSKFCTFENRSVPVNSGSGKDMTSCCEWQFFGTVENQFLIIQLFCIECWGDFNNSQNMSSSYKSAILELTHLISEEGGHL